MENFAKVVAPFAEELEGTKLPFFGCEILILVSCGKDIVCTESLSIGFTFNRRHSSKQTKPTQLENLDTNIFQNYGDLRHMFCFRLATFALTDRPLDSTGARVAHFGACAPSTNGIMCSNFRHMARA